MSFELEQINQQERNINIINRINNLVLLQNQAYHGIPQFLASKAMGKFMVLNLKASKHGMESGEISI